MRVGILVFTENAICEKLYNENRYEELIRIFHGKFSPSFTTIRSIDLMKDVFTIMNSFSNMKSRTFLGKATDARKFIIQYTAEQKCFEDKLKSKDAQLFIVHTSVSEPSDMQNVFRIMKANLDKVYTFALYMNGKPGDNANFTSVTYTSQTMSDGEIIDAVFDDAEHRIPHVIERIKYEIEKPEQLSLWKDA